MARDFFKDDFSSNEFSSNDSSLIEAARL